MNLWSGGDYLHDTTGVFSSSNREISVSSDWSSKGNESFLWESDSTVTDLFRIPAGSYDEGTYILKMDVYSPTVSVNIIFFNSSDIQSRVTVPKSDEITPVELTLTPNNTNYLSCRVSASNGTKFYCDNICIVSTQ